MHGHDKNNSDRDNAEDNASLASESLSSISDNTDMFHAEVLDEESMTWTTEQDMETRRVEHLAQYLRAHPLLPPDPQDATKDWLDATSGIKFPAIHCAFSGCAWTQDKSSAHYDDALLSHLRSVHFNPNEPQSELWRSMQTNTMAYYTAAIRVREEAKMPDVGVSVDRRCFQHLSAVYNDDVVQELVCFVCAQNHFRWPEGEPGIYWKDGKWVQ